MATVAMMTVTMESMDYNVRTRLAEYLYDTVMNTYDRDNVSTEEFKAVLDSGARADAEAIIIAEYNFVDDLTINILDSEFQDLVEYMYA